MSRTIAIGDIHGCAVALRSILGMLEIMSTDTIVVLGDYIDHGSDSRNVLEQLIPLQKRCRLIKLLGNHERMLLAALDSTSEFNYWLKFGGGHTLLSYGLDPISRASVASLPREHLQFIRDYKLYWETETCLFAHAWVDPDRPIAEQSEDKLIWTSLDPTKVRPHASGKKVVVGHTPQRTGKVLDLGHFACIDTTCCDGGVLTAYDVDAERIWQSKELS